VTIRLGDEAPDFVADTTRGAVRFREWKRGAWAMLFSHPQDFTPISTSEFAAVAALMPEFEKRDTRVIAVSVDPVDAHYRWLNAIEQLAGAPVTFPIAEDPNRWIANLYGIIDSSAGGGKMARSVFVIDPNDHVRLMLAYPACTGRNFAELLRVFDSLQLADARGVATPEGWQSGQDVVDPAR
jgi:alkyl hydroperoxide reductase subunit AhpC